MDNRDNIYNLPRKTEEILIRLNPTQECQNLGLLLDKYVPKDVFEKPSRENPQAGKTSWLSSIFKPQSKNETQNNHIDAAFAKNVYDRWYAMTETLGAQYFSATTDWRMVIGLGGESVLETDITLHHLYGTPFIPGSALKGLTRAYISEEYKEYYVPEDKPEEQRRPSKKIDDDHSKIKRIFGSQKQAGTVIFFDALPMNGKATFELDIMNPHYPDYYGKGDPPTNDQNPNPVTFLTVANTAFTFALAPRNSNDDEHKAHVELVKGWLQEALQKYGVGGKTSAGYGYFKDIKYGQGTTPVEQASQTVSTPKLAPPSAPAERIRPPIPNFRAGQDITGAVVAPTDELRRRVPAEAKAFLRYSSFALKDVLIVVEAEEAQNWKPGETRICLFVREEVRYDCTLLVCQPRQKSKRRN
jgi:CRISPR type III-B/RAMP module RAMP protein Cmr6